jgi:DNA repair photolyase
MKHGVILSVSISTINDQITNMLEPGAATPLQRLQLIKQLKEEGFLAGVNAIPVLPFISDTDEELEKIISSAKEHNADYVLTGGLTLFGKEIADSKTLYYKFLERYDPSLLPKYYKLYGENFYTPFSYQNELKAKADKLCVKHKIRNSILK